MGILYSYGSIDWNRYCYYEIPCFLFFIREKEEMIFPFLFHFFKKGTSDLQNSLIWSFVFLILIPGMVFVIFDRHCENIDLKVIISALVILFILTLIQILPSRKPYNPASNSIQKRIENHRQKGSDKVIAIFECKKLFRIRRTDRSGRNLCSNRKNSIDAESKMNDFKAELCF